MSVKFICLLAFLSVAYASRNEANRNMLHYSPASGWQGPPAALVASPDGTLRVYYEQPVTAGTSGTAKLQWGVTSTKDGVSWTDSDKFLADKGNSGTGDLTEASFLQGGALANPLQAIKQKLIYLTHAIYSSKDGKKKEDSIRVRWSNDGLVSTRATTSPTLKATGAAPFQVGNDLFFATVDATKKCDITFNKVTAKNATELTLAPAGTYSFSEKSCRGVQIGQLGKQFVISASLSSSGSTPMRARYVVAEIALNGGKLEAKNIAAEGFLDYGDDAQDFKFAQFKGQLVAIGWNGNALYQDGYPTTAWKNGMTVLRTLSSVLNKQLIQAPFDFSSKKLAETKIGKATTISTKDCKTSFDLSKLEGKKAGVFIFDLEFSVKDSFNTKGFKLAFQGDNEEVVVSFRGTNKEYSVDRTKTKVFPGSENRKIASVELPNGVPLTSTQKVKIILDKSVIEVYGNNGGVVLTESYFLKGKDFSKVCLSAIGADVTMTTNSKYGKYATMWTSTTTNPPKSNAALLSLSAAAAIIFASLLA